MKTQVILMLAAMTLMSVQNQAQETEKKFGIEFNGGLSLATQKVADARMQPGFGYEGLLSYRFMPSMGVYAGWGWNKCASKDSFAGKDIDFEETGYVVGLEFRRAFAASDLTGFVRAGGLYSHLELENNDGDIIADTGHGFGFQLAGGIDVPLGKNWSLMPGIKFNSLQRDVAFEGVDRNLQHHYVSARLGVIKRF